MVSIPQALAAGAQSSRVDGETDVEGGPNSFRAFDGNAPSMSLDHIFDDLYA
jgi:hypothetical protein